MNRKLVAIASLLGILICTTGARPQRGTAENGYYPPGYAGDTFTGVVTAADDASRSITLTYTDPKGRKSDTLVASRKATRHAGKTVRCMK